MASDESVGGGPVAPPPPPPLSGLPRIGTGTAAQALSSELEAAGLLTTAAGVAPPASHCDGLEDVLDGQMDVLSNQLAAATDLDDTAIELAGLLVAKGDEASTMRAHRVLAECGIAMGAWTLSLGASSDLEATPNKPNKPNNENVPPVDPLKPLGAAFLTNPHRR